MTDKRFTLIEIPLDATDRQSFVLPKGSQILSVFAPGGKWVAFALVGAPFIPPLRDDGHNRINPLEWWKEQINTEHPKWVQEDSNNYLGVEIICLSASLRRTLAIDPLTTTYLNAFNVQQVHPDNQGRPTEVQAIFHAFVKYTD
jgi:hypothetical protein